VDISKDDSSLTELGIDQVAAMRRLHALDERGDVVSGVSAFVVVWRQLPVYRHLAWLVERAGMVSLLDRLYVRFADWRFRRRCESGACASRP
jgi:predicted DCC family thiol-disulfide oxidoreductase YuxK